MERTDSLDRLTPDSHAYRVRTQAHGRSSPWDNPGMHSGRAALVLLPLGTFIACLSLGLSQTAPAGPEQPVPFSHKWHAGNLKLECKKCHANPDPGEVMGIAKPAVCLECHATVKTDSPHIQKLAAAGKEERDLRWVRIYRIPEWVSFSHRARLEKDN